ncbi:LysM peptidoglycan-binding domain-containing protein [Macrococcus epidermidis]|uniref:C40 family peptidase n=1 Tax=Macrococcus epidermidis TaxID=1902580 RepID=UPI001EF1BF26|nr:LysM peptidoglycan-binding domain-containing protein [Macrococcus epidermidis]MCG7419445.1 LysM peptidoglycan-binding domain-containing protein [Macrococcus epidermidis]
MKRLVLSIVGLTTIITVASQAQASNYHVKQGDTLYTIAKENGTSVYELKLLNNLNETQLTPGQKIKISSDYYKVTKDDTVQSIAKKFKITPFEVRFWNRLSSNELTIGKKLIVSEDAYRKYKEKKRKNHHVTPALSPDSARILNEIDQKELKESINNEETDINEEMDSNDIQVTVDENYSSESDAQNIDAEYYTQNSQSLNESSNAISEENTQSNTLVDKSTQKKTFNMIEGDVARIAHRIAEGKSYVYGANSNNAVDCSAFAQQVLKALGKSIPRTTYEQMAVGTRVLQPQPGDLVFFNYGSHVGVYIGNGQMVDALNPKAGVGQRAVNYISGTITGYFRY